MVHVRYGIHYTKLMQNYALLTTGYDELTYIDKQQAEIAAESLRVNNPNWKVQLVEFMADFEVPAEIVPFDWIREQFQ